MRKHSILFLLCLSPLLHAQHGGDIEEVTVRARPEGFQQIDHITQGLSVLGRDELREKVSNSIGETLAGELGVSASDFGQGASRPVIRGLGGARVRVMMDNIASLDVSSISVDHPVSIDPGQAEQIEILRGPATLLYGSGAFGGLVNISTGRIPDHVPDQFAFDMDFRLDSASNGKHFGFRSEGGSGPMAMHIDGQFRNAEDYEAGNGKIENSAVESEDLNFGISFFGKRGYLGASLGRNASNYGIPLNPDEPDERVSIDQDQDRFDIAARLEKPIPGLRSARFRLGYVDYEHTEFENPGEPGTMFFNNEWEGRAEFHHQPVGEWNGTFGLQYRNRRFNSVGDEAFVPRSSLDSWGVFLLEDTDRGKWHFELGLRYEEQEARSILGETKHSVYSLSSGALYELAEDHRLGLAFTRAQRAPSIEELLASGPHLASSTFEEGSTDLKEESANNIEISLRRTQGKWRWAANVYANYIEDFIYQQEQDENNDGIADEVDDQRMPGGELLLINYSQDNALFYGVEAQTTYTLHDDHHGRFDARLWGDWVRAKLTDGKGNLPRIPPARIGASLEYNQGYWHGDIEASYQFQQDQTAALESSTGAYTLLNAGLGYQREVGRMYINVSLRARNLLDETARRHTSFLKQRAPLPGRSLMFTLGLGF